ncbi:MAG: hypothetical protein J5J06_08885 [Phycisphaerae bacterium]|nr:hypothetical protein [Phycisphaerae bacterium]
MERAAFFAWIVTAVLLGGCRATGPRATEYSLSPEISVPRELALAAVESALIEQGLKIESRDWAAGLIQTAPVPIPNRNVDFITSARLSTPRPQRMIVDVRVVEADGANQVYCRARVQQQVSQAYRMATEDWRGDDRPGVTPIEAEAGSTAEQNVVWEFARRDRRMERMIVDAVTSRLAADGG